MTINWHVDQTEMIYEYVNRRWKEETGSYPNGDEPMIIVLVSSILAELHDQACPNRPDTTNFYAPAIPDQTRRGSLSCEAWESGAARVHRHLSE